MGDTYITQGTTQGTTQGDDDAVVRSKLSVYDVRKKIIQYVNSSSNKVFSPQKLALDIIRLYDELYFDSQVKNKLLGYGIDNYPEIRPCKFPDPDDMISTTNEYNKLLCGCNLYVVCTATMKPTNMTIFLFEDLWKNGVRVKGGTSGETTLAEIFKDQVLLRQKDNMYMCSPRHKVRSPRTGRGVSYDVQSNKSFPKGKQYTLYGLMYVMEHVIIHMLQVLLGYHDKKVVSSSKIDSRHIYSDHGLLFRCLIKEYYGYDTVTYPPASMITIHKIEKRIKVSQPRDVQEGYNSEVVGGMSNNPVTPRHMSMSPEQINNLGLLKWDANSCFFDSLMMVIFYGSSSYPRDVVGCGTTVPCGVGEVSDNIPIATNTSSIITHLLNEKGKYVNPFPHTHVTSTSSKFMDHRETIKKYFSLTFEKLVSGKLLVARSLRTIMSKCDTAISNGQQYEPFMVYDMLCELFPELSIKQLPHFVISDNTSTTNTTIPPTLRRTPSLNTHRNSHPAPTLLSKKIRYEDKFTRRGIPAIPMDEFVSTPQNIKSFLKDTIAHEIPLKNSGCIYDYDNADSEMLVFYIQHPPWLKNWSSMTPENVEYIEYALPNDTLATTSSVYDCERGNDGDDTDHDIFELYRMKGSIPRDMPARPMTTYLKKTTREFIKHRIFEEYILNGKYRLYAAIIHAGNIVTDLSSVSCGHYTVILRPYFDNNSWYYYNDLSPSFTKISEGRVPPNTFLDLGDKRPHMFFYEKIK